MKYVKPNLMCFGHADKNILTGDPHDTDPKIGVIDDGFAGNPHFSTSVGAYEVDE